MSLTIQRPEINTLKDVATNPNYQPVVHKGATAESMFLVCILTNRYVKKTDYLKLL